MPSLRSILRIFPFFLLIEDLKYDNKIVWRVLERSIDKGKSYKIRRQPTDSEYEDMLFGWLVESGITSNSVIYVKDEVTVGILLIGAAVGTFFTGSSFILNDFSQVKHVG